jgi:glucose-1-phosphate thymidylyltransferase
MKLKGVILAGGTGSRLHPLTKITNKHLLPVYDRPMIYYPIETLRDAGIKDIMIVSGRGHAGGFLELLGSGHEFGVNLSYAIQEEAGGIAQALSLTKDFVGDNKMVVVLGDNIFEDNLTTTIETFEKTPIGARIFLKEVEHPEHYGVARIEKDKIIEIVEKPKQFIGNLAVTGLYLYDNQVWDVIKNLKPSGRGELEITDVNNFYIQQGTMKYDIIPGWWADGGESIDTWLEANNLLARRSKTSIPQNIEVIIKETTEKVVKETMKLMQSHANQTMNDYSSKYRKIYNEQEEIKSPEEIKSETKENPFKNIVKDEDDVPFDINNYYTKD